MSKVPGAEILFGSLSPEDRPLVAAALFACNITGCFFVCPGSIVPPGGVGERICAPLQKPLVMTNIVPKNKSAFIHVGGTVQCQALFCFFRGDQDKERCFIAVARCEIVLDQGSGVRSSAPPDAVGKASMKNLPARSVEGAYGELTYAVVIGFEILPRVLDADAEQRFCTKRIGQLAARAPQTRRIQRQVHV